jgi:hypothetical protein
MADRGIQPYQLKALSLLKQLGCFGSLQSGNADLH